MNSEMQSLTQVWLLGELSLRLGQAAPKELIVPLPQPLGCL